MLACVIFKQNAGCWKNLKTASGNLLADSAPASGRDGGPDSSALWGGNPFCGPQPRASAASQMICTGPADRGDYGIIARISRRWAPGTTRADKRSPSYGGTRLYETRNRVSQSLIR